MNVEKVVEETFEGLFALIDLRQIFREIKPTYELNNKQKDEVHKILTRLKLSLASIEKELM